MKERKRTVGALQDHNSRKGEANGSETNPVQCLNESFFTAASQVAFPRGYCSSDSVRIEMHYGDSSTNAQALAWYTINPPLHPSATARETQVPRSTGSMNPPFVVSCTLPGLPTTIFSAGMPEVRISNTDELPLLKSVSQSSYPGLGDSAGGHRTSVERDTTTVLARRLTVIKLDVVLGTDNRLKKRRGWRRIEVCVPNQ